MNSFRTTFTILFWLVYNFELIFVHWVYEKLYFVRGIETSDRSHATYLSGRCEYLKKSIINERRFTRMRPEAALQRCSQEKLSGNMHQIYRRTIMPKCNLLCNFIEITLRHSCFPVNLLHVFKTTFPKNTYEGLFLFGRKIAVLYSFAIIQD